MLERAAHGIEPRAHAPVDDLVAHLHDEAAEQRGVLAQIEHDLAAQRALELAREARFRCGSLSAMALVTRTGTRPMRSFSSASYSAATSLSASRARRCVSSCTAFTTMGS